jgi:hypothetical protein
MVSRPVEPTSFERWYEQRGGDFDPTDREILRAGWNACLASPSPPEAVRSDGTGQDDKGSFDPRIHIPGVWRCAKCQFRLIQSNLNAQDGTVTARDEASAPCPNCAVPLWRVTWREEAEDLIRTQDETWGRALEAGKRYGDELREAARALVEWYDGEFIEGADELFKALRLAASTGEK